MATEQLYKFQTASGYRDKTRLLLAHPAAQERLKALGWTPDEPELAPNKAETDRERLESIRDAHMTIVRARDAKGSERAQSAKAARDAMRDLASLETGSTSDGRRREVATALAELRPECALCAVLE